MMNQTAAAALVALMVNGRNERVAASPFVTLADALRCHGLTGTKIGCEAGDCGACTVLLDGKAVYSCLVSTAQAVGCDIRTIESVTDDVLAERLVDAFVTHGAAQCGICTPGMIAAARSLLQANPRPSVDEIETAIGGVLCRCTGYRKIVEAVAAVATGAVLPSSEIEVGSRAANDAARLAASGMAQFGADYAPADALSVRVIRSPHAHGRFSFGDLDAFRRAKGLEAILTSADVPGANSFGVFPNTKDQPVFAEAHVRFRGEAVAALVGTDDALAAIDDADFPVRWTALTPLIGTDAALADDAPAIHSRIPDNVLTRGNLKRGDVERGHASAAAIASGAFETGFVEHAYIEPEAGYAIGTGEHVQIAACTQAPYMDREDVARVLGIPETEVRITPTACGGGFGGKLDVSVQPILAVALAKVRKPVRIVYSRIESMASTTKRHPAKITAKASADADGRLVAYEMSGEFNTGAYASWGPTVANRVPIHAHGPYNVPNVWNRTRAVFTNEPPSGAFRGFGVPQAAIANECLMDDLAAQLDMDRWQIRRINALGNGDTTASGQTLLQSAGLPECLDALKPAWDEALAAAAAHNATDPRHKRGAGIACMWYGCGNTALPNPSEMQVTLERDGRVVIWSGAVDIGQGVSTVLKQIVQTALAIDGVRVEVCDVVGDTHLTLDAGKTSASRQTFVSGNAARLAALDLRSVFERAANVATGAPMRFADGAVIVGRSDERRLEIDESVGGFGRYDPETTPLDENGQGIPYATYGFAAQIAEVMVDTALGTTKVLHIHAAHDVGRAINPMLVEGQIHGGIAQGLGLALMEEYIPGRTENLHDYLIPTAGDVPPITTHIIEDPDPAGPFGAKGVGEPALIATAPAILSAIRHATGVTMRRVPVLPHRLWEALQAKEAKS